MINGLGVLGWGVGGIEAEAAMLGQPVTSMLIPQVIGFKLTGKLPEGAPRPTSCSPSPRCCARRAWSASSSSSSATASTTLPLADRATIANMAPEYGATCGIFPVDARRSLPALSGPQRRAVALVEAYAKAQGCGARRPTPTRLHRHARARPGTVEPSLAGPKRPQDRVRSRDEGARSAPLFKRLAAARRRSTAKPNDAVEGGRTRRDRRHRRSASTARSFEALKDGAW
jgi:aconitate hydratase